MLTNKPFYLRLCTLTCRLFSDVIAFLHYYTVRAGFVKIPLCFFNAEGGVYKNLQNIWFARLLRRVISLLVRTPFRSKTLRLVDFIIPPTDNTGCVIVTFHTPWARLLVQWCLENDFALIIAGGKWIQRTSMINKGKGFNGLRHLLCHLRSGGRIIIMATVFNNLKN